MGFTIMQTFMDEFRVTSVLHEGTRVEMTKCFGTRYLRVLDEKETLRLVAAAKEGDAAAKEALLVHNTPLLKSILRRYLNKGVE